MKVPPHDIETENIIIGSALLKIEAAEQVVGLDKACFYKPANQKIITAISDVLNNAGHVDVVTVANWLKDRGELDQVGGPVYLAGLCDCIPQSDLTDKIKYLQEKKYLRDVISTIDEIREICFTPVDKTSDNLRSRIEEIALQGSMNHKSDFESVASIQARVLQRIIDVSEGKIPPGVLTGVKDFDRLTQGLQESDLLIIAGRPSMGKSALMFSIAKNQAKMGIPVGVISMEMSKESLVQRMAAAISRINGLILKSGKLSDQEWNRLFAAMDEIKQLQIYINDKPAQTIEEIRSQGRKLKRQQDVAVIYLDYLQLSRTSGRSREEEVSKISSGLKAMAKELRIPVVALSQLSRSCEARVDKRPLLSDLRDSGGIEQDADIVVFVYRDEHYNPKTPDKGIAELLVRKHRNGPTGTVKAQYDGDFTTFKDLIRMHEPI